MWEWLKSLLGMVSPLGALREQISLKDAQLVEAHSLIAQQMQRIKELEVKVQKLQAQVDELDAAKKELADKLERLQSDSFTGPLKYNDRGIT